MLATPRHLFRQTGTVQRKTETASGGRSPVESWSDLTVGVAFDFQPMKTAKAVELYGAKRARRMYTVFCDPALDIKASDRIVYTDDRTSTSATRYLRVESAPQNLIELGAVLELDAESVEATP